MKLTPDQIHIELIKLDPKTQRLPPGMLAFARAIESLVSQQYEARIASLEKLLNESGEMLVTQAKTIMELQSQAPSQSQDKSTLKRLAVQCGIVYDESLDRFIDLLVPAPLAAQVQEHPDTKDAVPMLNIYAAAKTLAECMDYPWESMPETWRQNMMDHAKKIVDAAIQSASEVKK